jgi:SAM-dependent methyltransferase
VDPVRSTLPTSAPGGRVTASRFAGGDQGYLRDEQYLDDSRLAQRTNLHLRYGTATVPWFEWVGSVLDLRDGHQVLEVGCGGGALWEAVRTPVAVTLCDLSPGMVTTAVGRAEATGRLASVVGRTADAQALPFETAQFDRVVANHMLYHLPDPALGVAELARVLRDDGAVVAATNGRRHMAELHEVEAEVFGASALDQTVDVFGAEVGFGLLRERFADVHWLRYADQLRCTDPADVLAYSCSSPPGEDATPEQRTQLEAALGERFAAGGGVMTITKDSGVFVCRSPRT